MIHADDCAVKPHSALSEEAVALYRDLAVGHPELYHELYYKHREAFQCAYGQIRRTNNPSWSHLTGATVNEDAERPVPSRIRNRPKPCCGVGGAPWARSWTVIQAAQTGGMATCITVVSDWPPAHNRPAGPGSPAPVW
jgi:hypothetical protein